MFTSFQSLTFHVTFQTELFTNLVQNKKSPTCNSITRFLDACQYTPECKRLCVFTLSQQCSVCLLFHTDPDANFQRSSNSDTTDLSWEDLCKALCQHEREGTQTRHTVPSNPSEKTCVWRAATVVGAPANKSHVRTPMQRITLTSSPLFICTHQFSHDVPSLTWLCIRLLDGFVHTSGFQRAACTNVL